MKSLCKHSATITATQNETGNRNLPEN